MTGKIIQFALFLAVTGYGVYLFARVIYHRYLYIRLGKPVDMAKETRARLREFFVQVFGQTKLSRAALEGVIA